MVTISQYHYEMQKVVLITDTFCDANGVSRFISDMLIEANKKEDPFWVITSTVKTHCKHLANLYNLKPFLRMKMPFYKELDLVIPPFLTLFFLVKKINPAIVHIATPGTIGLSGLIVAKLLRKKAVGVYHTDFPAYVYQNTKCLWLKKLTLWYVRLFYKNFVRIFARSKSYQRKISYDLQREFDSLPLIYPAINQENFSPKFRDAKLWELYGISQTSLKFLYVGRVSVEKNIQFLLDVWKEFIVKLQMKNCDLIIVGNGELEQQAKELQDYRVHFLGHKEEQELSSIYASADIFLFPSTTDTLGQVVLEALSSGLFVFVSDKGGPKEIVYESKVLCGYILNTDKKQLWIDALENIVEEDLVYLKQQAFKSTQDISIQRCYEDFMAQTQKAIY